MIIQRWRERDGHHDDWQQETADLGDWACDVVEARGSDVAHVVYASY